MGEERLYNVCIVESNHCGTEGTETARKEGWTRSERAIIRVNLSL